MASTSRLDGRWDKIGSWKRIVKLGNGGFGSIYLGKRTSDDKLFAVKSAYFEPRSGSKDGKGKKKKKRSQKVVEMFSLASLINEIRTLKKLKSPYIVRYLGCGTSEGPQEMDERLVLDCYLEYLPRGSLSGILEGSPGQTFPEPFVKAYTKDLLHALEYLHFNKLVHGDVKCLNILMGPNNCKLADFGSVKDVRTSFFKKILIGTPDFKAPEVRARTEQTYASDIFSVGCTIVEMVTGKHPAPRKKKPGVKVDKTFANRNVPDHLSPQCKDFLSKCFAADPRSRWTASALLKHPFVTEPSSPRWRPYDIPLGVKLTFDLDIVVPHLIVPPDDYSSCLPAAPCSPIPVVPTKRRRLLAAASCRNIADSDVVVSSDLESSVDGPRWSGNTPQWQKYRPQSPSSQDKVPSPINTRAGARNDKESAIDSSGGIVRPPPCKPELYPRDSDGNYIVPRNDKLISGIRNNPRAMAAIASIDPGMAAEIARVPSEVGSVPDSMISDSDYCSDCESEMDSDSDSSVGYGPVAKLKGKDEDKSPLVVKICSEFGIPLPPQYGPAKGFQSRIDRALKNIRGFVQERFKRPRNS